MLAANSEGKEVVYLDESIFKVYTVEGYSWAAPFCNHTLAKGKVKFNTLALGLRISPQAGVASLILREKSLNKYDVVELIENLTASLRTQGAIIFMDNLPAHKSKVVQNSLN